MIPLLNVHRTEEELTAANEEIESLKQKFGRAEKERSALQERNDFLEARLTEMSTDLQVGVFACLTVVCWPCKYFKFIQE